MVWVGTDQVFFPNSYHFVRPPLSKIMFQNTKNPQGRVQATRYKGFLRRVSETSHCKHTNRIQFMRLVKRNLSLIIKDFQNCSMPLATNSSRNVNQRIKKEMILGHHRIRGRGTMHTKRRCLTPRVQCGVLTWTSFPLIFPWIAR